MAEPLTDRIALALKELRDPAVLLGAALALMLAAGFFTPTGSAWSDLFYVICGPAILVALWRGKYAEDWRKSSFFLPVALILWSTFSVIWCTDPGPRNNVYLVYGFCTLVFFVGLVVALRQPGFWRVAGNALIWFGTFNAGVSLVAYPWRNGIGGRLGGFGETRQAILGASVISAVAMFALARAFYDDARPKAWRLAYLAAASVMILFVALTQSRGPLAGLAAGVLVLALFSRRRWWFLAALIGVPVVLWVLDRAVHLPWLDHAWRAVVIGPMTQRGTSFRPEIWRASLTRIAQHPWIGHGVGAPLGFENFTFPHDLYLSLLFYSGAVGLALFGGTVFRLLGGVLRRPGPERSLLVALWANMLVSGLTDYGQIIKGPSPLWYIVWLPIACSVEFVTRPRSGDVARLRVCTE